MGTGDMESKKDYTSGKIDGSTRLKRREMYILKNMDSHCFQTSLI